MLDPRYKQLNCKKDSLLNAAKNLIKNQLLEKVCNSEEIVSDINNAQKQKPSYEDDFWSFYDDLVSTQNNALVGNGSTARDEFIIYLERGVINKNEF